MYRFVWFSLSAACSGAHTAAPRPQPLATVAPSDPLEGVWRSYLEENGLTPVGVEVQTRPQPSDSPDWRIAPQHRAAEGLLPGERLVRLRERGRPLAFVASTELASCGAWPEVAYRVARAADGTLVIVRIAPQVRVIEEYRAGPCTSGCGPPPILGNLLLILPKAERIRAVTILWEVEHIIITCDDPHIAQ